MINTPTALGLPTIGVTTILVPQVECRKLSLCKVVIILDEITQERGSDLINWIFVQVFIQNGFD